VKVVFFRDSLFSSGNWTDDGEILIDALEKKRGGWRGGILPEAYGGDVGRLEGFPRRER